MIRFFETWYIYTFVGMICFVIGCSATTKPTTNRDPNYNASTCCPFVVTFRFVVDSLYFCCGFCCIACCTTNSQQVSWLQFLTSLFSTNTATSETTNPQQIKQMEFAHSFMSACGTLFAIICQSPPKIATIYLFCSRSKATTVSTASDCQPTV